jgi:hypothetical protein
MAGLAPAILSEIAGTSPAMTWESLDNKHHYSTACWIARARVPKRCSMMIGTSQT